MVQVMRYIYAMSWVEKVYTVYTLKTWRSDLFCLWFCSKIRKDSKAVRTTNLHFRRVEFLIARQHVAVRSHWHWHVTCPVEIESHNQFGNTAAHRFATQVSVTRELAIVRTCHRGSHCVYSLGLCWPMLQRGLTEPMTFAPPKSTKKLLKRDRT